MTPGDTLAAVEGQEFDDREAETDAPPPEPANTAIVEPPAPPSDTLPDWLNGVRAVVIQPSGEIPGLRAEIDRQENLHPLDKAPPGSKIVKTLDGAWLAGPGTLVKLPADDPAWGLPNGAKIAKRPDGLFVATQMSPALDKPDLIASSTLGAIKRFNPHFHEVRE